MELCHEWPVNDRRFGGRVMLLSLAADFQELFIPLLLNII
jgi:hypothetical protein